MGICIISMVIWLAPFCVSLLRWRESHRLGRSRATKAVVGWSPSTCIAKELLDRLVGAAEDRQGDSGAECLSGLKVDYELKFSRCLLSPGFSPLLLLVMRRMLVVLAQQVEAVIVAIRRPHDGVDVEFGWLRIGSGPDRGAGEGASSAIG